MNITYKITVEKGWYPWEQKVFKTFYLKDFAYANDLLFRLQRNQKIGFRRLGKFQMEQLLNSESVFLTNSVVKIVPVRNIQGKIFRIDERIKKLMKSINSIDFLKGN